MAGPKRTLHANGLRISTRCDTIEELVAKFYRFCEDSTLFIPNGNRAIGVETAFCFDLNDGRPAFCGLGTVVEQFLNKENRFGRPGIVLRIARLQSDSQRVYEDMLVARVARAPTRRAPTVERETPTPWIKPRSLTAAVEIVDSVTLKHVTIVPYPTRVAPIVSVTPPGGSLEAAPEPAPAAVVPAATPTSPPVAPAPAAAAPAKFASASSSIPREAIQTDFGTERGTPVFATSSSVHAGLAPARPSDPHVMMAPVPALEAPRPRWRQARWIALAIAGVVGVIVVVLIVTAGSQPVRPTAQTTPAPVPQPPPAAPAPAAPPPAVPPPTQVAPAEPPVQPPVANQTAKPPIASKPTAKKPTAKKPIAKKRVASKPTTKKSTTKKSTAKKQPAKTTKQPRRAPAKKAACDSLSCL